MTFWYTTAELELDDSHVTKHENLIIQDGRWSPGWKSLNLHTSMKNHPICDEICYMTADLELNDSHMTKYANF